MSSKYDYAPIYSTVKALVIRFGAEYTRKYADSTFTETYSPAIGGYVWTDGATTSNTQPYTTETAEGAITDFTEAERRDSSIKVGDKKLLTVEISTPQPEDIFVIGTTEYSYINHETIQPASTSDPLLYKIQLRV